MLEFLGFIALIGYIVYIVLIEPDLKLRRNYEYNERTRDPRYQYRLGGTYTGGSDGDNPDPYFDEDLDIIFMNEINNDTRDMFD